MSKGDLLLPRQGIYLLSCWVEPRASLVPPAQEQTPSCPQSSKSVERRKRHWQGKWSVCRPRAHPIPSELEGRTLWGGDAGCLVAADVHVLLGKGLLRLQLPCAKH